MKQGEEAQPSPGYEKPIYTARPILDGDLEIILLDDNPDRGGEIETGLPDLVRKQLKACLRQNSDLFAWSAVEIPRINPEVSYH